MNDIELLREAFDYNPETGLVTRKARPVERFKNLRIANCVNSRCEGSVVKAVSPRGYVVVSFMGRVLTIHRVIWAITHGAWPKADIDHINGIKTDNRLSNLREATRSENLHNVSRGSRNTSGYKNILWNKQRNCWIIVIRNKGRTLTKQGFKAIEEAIPVRNKMLRELHGEFANHG